MREAHLYCRFWMSCLFHAIIILSLVNTPLSNILRVGVDVFMKCTGALKFTTCQTFGAHVNGTTGESGASTRTLYTG